MERYYIEEIESKVLKGELVTEDEIILLLEDEYDSFVVDTYGGIELCTSIIDIRDRDRDIIRYFSYTYEKHCIWERDIIDGILEEVYLTPMVRYEWKTKKRN